MQYKCKYSLYLLEQEKNFLKLLAKLTKFAVLSKVTVHLIDKRSYML